jgi:hypothetical protein
VGLANHPDQSNIIQNNPLLSFSLKRPAILKIEMKQQEIPAL